MELSKSIFAFKTKHSYYDICPGDSGGPMTVFNGFQYDEMPVTDIISKEKRDKYIDRSDIQTIL